MARASKLTPELRADVERELAAGHAVAVIAQRHKIGRRTLDRWLADGRVVRRELIAEPETFPELTLDERLARAEPGLVAAILAASQRGSWQASAWMLERINPRRWARPQRPEARGPHARLPDPIFQELDELRERRARRHQG
jgi:hypothetical protein